MKKVFALILAIALTLLSSSAFALDIIHSTISIGSYHKTVWNVNGVEFTLTGNNYKTIETDEGTYNFYADGTFVKVYDKEIVQKVQQALNDAGFNCGTPDGIAGKMTAAAITDYQTAKGLTVTGSINDELLASLELIEEDDGEYTKLGEVQNYDDFTGSLIAYKVNRISGVDYLYLYIDYTNQSTESKMFDSSCFIFAEQEEKACYVPDIELPGLQFYEITLPKKTGRLVYAFELNNTNEDVLITMMPGSQARKAPDYREGIITYKLDIGKKPEDIIPEYTWKELQD